MAQNNDSQQEGSQPQQQQVGGAPSENFQRLFKQPQQQSQQQQQQQYVNMQGRQTMGHYPQQSSTFPPQHPAPIQTSMQQPAQPIYQQQWQQPLVNSFQQPREPMTRKRADLCTLIFFKHPHLINEIVMDKGDQTRVQQDMRRYSRANTLIVMVLPMQVFYAYKMWKVPEVYRPYSFRLSMLSFACLGYYLYTGMKHGEVEKEVYDKYMGHMSDDGLKDLSNGIPYMQAMAHQPQQNIAQPLAMPPPQMQYQQQQPAYFTQPGVASLQQSPAILMQIAEQHKVGQTGGDPSVSSLGQQSADHEQTADTQQESTQQETAAQPQVQAQQQAKGPAMQGNQAVQPGFQQPPGLQQPGFQQPGYPPQVQSLYNLNGQQAAFQPQPQMMYPGQHPQHPQQAQPVELRSDSPYF